MLFYKTNHRIQLRVAAIAIICGLLFSGASSYAVTDVSSDFALAPPLATKPPCEIVRNADGSFGVVTNTDVIESRDIETIRQDKTLGKSFRNRWAFVDIGYLIAQMLILTQEHKLRNPKDILIPLIKKHIRNRDGEAEILLEGFNIDGIEEMREGGEIIGFSLSVTRHGFSAYRLVYNLQSGETAIQMRDGKSVHIRVENSTYTQEVETAAQAPPHRLTIDECRQRLLENLRDLRPLFLSLQKEFAYGLEILKREGVDAFEKKAYPRIKEVADKIKVKVSAIKYLPAVLGFSEPEVQGRLNTFLRQIAEEAKVDKVLIWFGGDWGYDFTYTRGFSEQELITFHNNSSDIYDAIIKKEKPSDAEDEKKRERGRALLRECGIASGLETTPEWLDDGDNYIRIVIGRSEECAKTYGELAEEDRTSLTNRLNALIDARTAPWQGVRNWLKRNNYQDFNSFMTILRHNGGVDVFKINILPVIYRGLQYQIDGVKANDSESQKYFDKIVKNLEWMAQDLRIIKDIDAFLQILESGTDFKPRNITQYVHDRVESFRQETTAKGLTFTTELSNEDLTVPHCDLNLMGIVIDNLIQNAIKYTRQGSIKVRLTRKMMKEKFGNQKERDSIVLEVEDTGIGIPKDERDKIFQRGYRASNVADIQGTGIGLNAVSTITHIMMGDVEVASEVGKGTTFTIRLPTATEPLSERHSSSDSIREAGKVATTPVASTESERIHAANFQDTIAYIQAQPPAQPLIVALGTSWIKGYEKGRYLQYDALNPLIGSLRVYCESKGIPFIVDDDDKLLARINTERVKEGKTNAKVVVLAGENIAKSDEFAPLRNDEKNAFVVGVNNQELTTDSYIRLMEMLTLALRLCAGIEVSLDNAHITITKDNERHLYIFLPHAEPMDYEQLRQIYRVQEFA